MILTEAHAEARAVQRAALTENERLARESRLMRERLQAALAAVDVPEQPAEPAAQPADIDKTWPGAEAA